MNRTIVLFLTAVSIVAWTPPVSAEKPLLMAHYMPWYSLPGHVASEVPDDEVPDDAVPGDSATEPWGWHWTMNHFDPHSTIGDRRQIASHFYPAIGPYDSGDPAVLEYHLLLMKTAGIDGVIVDWYGLTDFNDYPMLHRNTQALFEAVSKLEMKFVVCYEDQTITALTKAGRLDVSDQVSHAVGEIDRMDEMWFGAPSYVKIDGKPILLSFGNAGLSDDQWKKCLAELRHPVAYFSEHTRRDGAIGAYDWPVPSMGMKASERFAKLSKSWQHAIPVAFPRFVDIYAEAGVNEGYEHIDDWGGETFKQTLMTASKFDAPMIQIATWNDWGEGTQIEPSREHGFRDLEMIQMFRRRYIDSTFAGKPIDLQLPLSLWKLRQAKPRSTDEAQTIANLIANGKLDAARAKLKLLPAPEALHSSE